jgi:glycosyltransferase involved in cell wall biosynthesis
MSLTVLNVAYPLAPVGPDAVGGAEQSVAALDRLLTHAGHRSKVIAAEGSTVNGKLIPSPGWRGQIDTTVRRWAAGEHRRLLSQVLRSDSVDLVHLHGLDFYEYLPEEPVPCLVTLHLPPSWYPPEIFELERPQTYFNCVSLSQRHQCTASPVPIRTICHGIDSHFETAARKRTYAVTMGRICPEKGFHFAIEAAERACVPLFIAGQVFAYSAHQEYFRSEVQPRLNEYIRFIGPVGVRTKGRLLGGARCLLVASTVAETSSLVAMEALASGTPVIAFRSGALPEIVEHGRTGFLVNDAAEMADAIHQAARLNPDDCRRSAKERFSAARMAEEYFCTYREITGSSNGFSSPRAATWPIGEAVEDRTSRTIT